MQRRFWYALAALAVLLCRGAAALCGDEPESFESVKKTVLENFRNIKPQQRAAALEPLADYPSVEAARILIEKGLKDRSDEVRRAAQETLLKFKDDPAVCEYLIDAVDKLLGRKTVPDEASAVVAVLLASEAPGIEEQVSKLFDQYLAKPRDGGQFLADLIEHWVGRADADSVRVLAHLAGSKAISSRFAFHRGVILSLTHIRLPETVQALIGLLATSKGEIRGDMVNFLSAATGQRLGLDAPAWQKWWDDNRATFKFPDGRLELNALPSSEGVASYYGLPLYAQRLVFVIDTSASMRGARLDAAKRELSSAILTLPTTTWFSVVAFNSQVTLWQPKLVAASQEHKSAALRFVAGQAAQAKTGSYDALEAAFGFDAEAIYFLSDGAPSAGKIVQRDQIVAAITRGNRQRLLTLHTVGVGIADAAGPFDQFMQALASQNFGRYRRVDQ
jgi:hypothetical protein